MSDLPRPPRPQGRYQPAIRHDGLVVTAGMTPRVDGRLHVVGQVGRDVPVHQAAAAAGLAARNAVACRIRRLSQ